MPISHRSAIALAMAGILTLGLAAAHAAESFHLQWSNVDQAGITVHIETTLPDHAEVQLTLSRTYEATTAGKTDTYGQDYFSADGTVGEWREPRHIPADDALWTEELRADQDRMAKLGSDVAFEVDSVDDHLKVTAYAYAHKTGERYGAREYDSIIAKIENRERVGKSEVRIIRPMATTAVAQKQSSFVAWDALVFRGSYRLVRSGTALMPSLDGGIDGTARMVYLPANTIITVIGISHQQGTPRWYHVSLPDHQGREGWINSIALQQSGVLRLEQTATAIDHREAIIAHVIDPCFADAAARTLGTTDEAQITAMVTIVKEMYATTVDQMVSGLLPVVSTIQDANAQTTTYEAAKTLCINEMRQALAQ